MNSPSAGQAFDKLDDVLAEMLSRGYGLTADQTESVGFVLAAIRRQREQLTVVLDA